jgi:cell division septation protein DedD
VRNRRLTSRDYKGTHRSAFSWVRWREFFAGLALGLLIALVVFISDRRAGQVEVASAKTAGAGDTTAVTAGGDAGRIAGALPTASIDPAAPTTDARDFSFYSSLPNLPLEVPEQERAAQPGASGRVDKPGTYWLQVGAWRDFDQAERTRANLARQDINAAIQRVAIDDDVWHRVRVGPLQDLAELERLRAKLIAAEYQPVVMRGVSEPR